MYKSPIELIENLANETVNELGNVILKAVMSVGVNVNKDELIKALAYDRNQYKLGFEEGYLKGIHAFAEQCKEDLMCKSFGLNPKGIDRILEEMERY